MPLLSGSASATPHASPMPSILHSSPLLAALHAHQQDQNQGHLVANTPTSPVVSSFQTTAIYREILEKALSDTIESAAKERTAAANKIKKVQHERQQTLAKLRRVTAAFADSAGVNARETGETRERAAGLERERDALRAEIERVRREAAEQLARERDAWQVKASEEKREMAQELVATAVEKERAIAREREAAAERIKGTEKALAEARHLIHHLEQTSENLRQEVFEALELKTKAEAATAHVSMSFSKYRRMVSDAVEVTKDFSHERGRRHSTTPSKDLGTQLKRAMSLESLQLVPESSPILPDSPRSSASGPPSSTRRSVSSTIGSERAQTFSFGSATTRSSAPTSVAASLLWTKPPVHDEHGGSSSDEPAEPRSEAPSTSQASVESIAPSTPRRAASIASKGLSVPSPGPRQRNTSTMSRKNAKDTKIWGLLKRITATHPDPNHA